MALNERIPALTDTKNVNIIEQRGRVRITRPVVCTLTAARMLGITRDQAKMLCKKGILTLVSHYRPQTIAMSSIFNLLRESR